jgi:hypothetical protein
VSGAAGGAAVTVLAALRAGVCRPIVSRKSWRCRDRAIRAGHSVFRNRFASRLRRRNKACRRLRAGKCPVRPFSLRFVMCGKIA